MAKQLQHPKGLTVQRLHAAQKGCFLIQRLPAIGAKCGRDTKRFSLDEGIAGGIPGGVTARLKGSAQATGWKRRSIWLPSDQFLSGEFHNHSAIWRRGDEAVMLFRRDPSQGLEPVGEVGRAVFDCPVLHCVGHRIGYRQVQLGPFLNGVLQRVIYLPGQTGFHHTAVKDHASKYFWYSRHSSVFLSKK